MDRPYNLLFLCTGNSARSILAEAMANHLGKGRFHAYSAGSHPRGRVHPIALQILQDAGLPTATLRSKPWDEFATADAPPMDLIITVWRSVPGLARPSGHGALGGRRSRRRRRLIGAGTPGLRPCAAPAAAPHHVAVGAQARGAGSPGAGDAGARDRQIVLNATPRFHSFSTQEPSMSIRVGINGFGRMGRLTLRAAWDNPDLQFVQINDPAGDAATLAHLLAFDSVHGRWDRGITAEGEALVIEGTRIPVTRNKDIAATDWSGCDVVIESSGKFRKPDVLQPYLDQGVKRVVVTAPVKSPGVLDVVVGVNHHRFDPAQHRIVSAASCTTNCFAPVVKVIHEGIGIRHGSLTTIHSLTNTQVIVDAPHKDLRRARACGSSLIPTSTGSATAIAEIFPELKGRLNGHAVRVPLTNASLTDCVFEVERATTVEEVNALLKTAADGMLAGILGYETRPLVSIDYRTDPRSSIVDALSTLVINGTQVKLYAWYDNEWGYVNRTAELVHLVGKAG